MTDSKKIFLDTAPLIYYLQENEHYCNYMKQFWKDFIQQDFVTSAITITEYLTYPYRQNDLKLIQDFYLFIEDMDIKIKEIDREVAEKAAKIRANYPFFKTMDSLQLASACLTKCEMFLTNDKQLKQFQEIPCVLVGEQMG